MFFYSVFISFPDIFNGSTRRFENFITTFPKIKRTAVQVRRGIKYFYRHRKRHPYILEACLSHILPPSFFLFPSISFLRTLLLIFYLMNLSSLYKTWNVLKFISNFFHYFLLCRFTSLLFQDCRFQIKPDVTFFFESLPLTSDTSR